MSYRIAGVDYEVSFEDFTKEDGFIHRHFCLKNRDGKGWLFSVIYKMDGKEITDCRYLDSGLEMVHRETIFEQSQSSNDDTTEGQSLN